MKPMISAVSVATALLFCATTANAAEWSDTSISYTSGSKFQEPFNKDSISKSIIGLTHISGYKYGTNFVNVDLLESNSVDSNAQEAYVVYRNTIDFGKVSGKEYKFGIVRGVGLTAGFDWNTKNDPGYASKKHMLVIGPTLMIDVPGHLNISLLILKESNYPNFIKSRYSYKTHPEIDMNWGIPIGSTGASFEGYADFIASKGDLEGGPPATASATETNINMWLMYDLGAAIGGSKNTFRAGVGYQYWKNKFGNSSSTVVGATAKTPMLKVEYHF